MNDLIYKWKDDDAVEMTKNLSLPGGFKLDGFGDKNCDVKTATGMFCPQKRHHLCPYSVLNPTRCLQLSEGRVDLCQTAFILHSHDLCTVLHDCRRFLDVILDWSQGCKFYRLFQITVWVRDCYVSQRTCLVQLPKWISTFCCLLSDLDIFNGFFSIKINSDLLKNMKRTSRVTSALSNDTQCLCLVHGFWEMLTFAVQNQYFSRSFQHKGFFWCFRNKRKVFFLYSVQFIVMVAKVLNQ